MEKIITFITTAFWFNASAQICFGPIANYTATAPNGICTADFNKDGFSDVAITNNNGYNSISVYINNGAGSLNTPTNYTTSYSSGGAIISKDFNGDGLLDLVGNGKVLLGNGTGNFTDTNLPGVAGGAMASGDFNGDGFLDLATQGSGNLAVFLGNGTGGFTSYTTTVNTSETSGLTTADFNGDGILDLASTGGGNVGLFLGTGTGSFWPETVFNLGLTYSSSTPAITTGDFNQDGKADLATANNQDATISVLLGNGIGSFSHINYSVSNGNEPGSIYCADFNGDGYLDIATSDTYNKRASILLGHVSGTFSGINFYSLPVFSVGVVGGDFNGDGKIDLASTGYTPSNYVSVLLNTTPHISITGNTTVCLGSSTTLKASGATSSYSWANNGASSDSIVVSPTTTTTYSVTGFSGSCSNSNTIIVTVPALTIITSTTSICSGTSTILSGNGATSYTWLPGNITTSTISVTPSSTTNYTLTGISGTCNLSKNISVNVTATPTLNIVGNFTTCYGSSILLNGSGATNYTWMPSSIHTSSVSVTPLTNTTYTLIGKTGNCNATETVAISVSPLPVISVTGDTNTCSSSTKTLTATGANTYTWSANAGSLISNLVMVTPDTTTVYTVIGTDATTGCSANAIDTIKIATCFVWPGDANEDLAVDNNDLLEVGVEYGKTGPARSSVTNYWNGYACANWIDTLSNGYNTKYADCDGNGTINLDDTMAININFGVAHSLRTVAPSIVQSINPDIFLTFNQSQYLPGDTVKAYINIGSNANIQNNFYGSAFTIQYDNTKIQSGTEQILYNNSWVGTINYNTIKFSYIDSPNGLAYASLVRINHTDTTGYGKIATFQFVLDSGLNNSQLYFMVTNAIKINHMGTGSMANLGVDSIMVVNETTGIKQEIKTNEQVKVYPNPTSCMLHVEGLMLNSTNKIEVTDVLGSTLIQHSAFNTQHCTLDVSGLPAGVYFIKTTQGASKFIKQ